MHIGLAGAQPHSIASTQQRHLCSSPCAGPCIASRSGITTCLTSAMWQMYYCWYICGCSPTQHTCTRCVAASYTARRIPLLGSCTCISTLVTTFAAIVVLKSVAALCCSVSCSNIVVQVTFAYAAGPLAWSVVAFRNSLVFHSLDKVQTVHRLV